MSFRVRDLTPTLLGELPPPCRTCVFWEAEGPRGGEGDTGLAAVAKEAWWHATQLEWGASGKAVYQEDALAAFAVFAPAPHFPRTRRLGPAPSSDALLLATLWVAPEHRGTGVATLLLQSLLRETHRHRARALECYGDRIGGLDASQPPSAASGRCMLPEGFLLAAGFTVRSEHAVHPLLRLDLRQTVRWKESVGHALEGVVTALSRRERTPAPVRSPAGTASFPR